MFLIRSLTITTIFKKFPLLSQASSPNSREAHIIHGVVPREVVLLISARTLRICKTAARMQTLTN